MIGNGNGGATEGAARFLAVAATSPPEKVEKTDRWQKKETANAKVEQRKAETARVVEAATAPLKEKLAEKEGELVRKNAAVSILVQCKDELIVEKKALEAELDSATNRRGSMTRKKLQTILNIILALATGYLGYHIYQMNEHVDELESYCVARDLERIDALASKGYLEVTPQMEEIGVEKFVPIAQRLPYTDAAILEYLFNEDRWAVEKVWVDGGTVVVWLRNWFESSYERGALLINHNQSQRSLLIHPHPVSVNVYGSAQQHLWNEINIWNFSEPELYSTDNENTLRIVSCMATAPTITHAELVKLGGMYPVQYYDSGVLFLIAPFGAGEQFVHLAADDAQRMRSEWGSYASYKKLCGIQTLRDMMGYNWWDAITNAATKEEQTTAK